MLNVSKAPVSRPLRQPVYYLSHGGGPWPYMDGAFRSMFSPLERALQAIPSALPARPRAILVISGHWETREFMLSAASRPGMIYDYSGFPPELNHIHYPAPGEPTLAREIARLLEQQGWHVTLDHERGYDHGTYSLLQPIYPQADIPVLQMSIRTPLDPAEHLAIGAALQPLREQGVLILGSGQSFHNLQLHGPQARAASLVFDTWLRHSLLNTSTLQRNAALLAWENVPGARQAHPHADHFIPLLVVAGAAGDEAACCIFGDFLADFATSAYCFGGSCQESEFDRLRLHQGSGVQP